MLFKIKITMLCGKIRNNKWHILVLYFCISSISCESPTCNDSCKEKQFRDKIDIGRYNQDGIEFYKKLDSLALKENQEKEIRIKDLFDKEVSKIILVERMSIEFNKVCFQLSFDSILIGKEYCQLLKVEYLNKDIGYIFGRCEYDLMGFTKPYNKVGFDLPYKVQYLLPLDLISVLYTPKEREKFSIDSKNYKQLNLDCK